MSCLLTRSHSFVGFMDMSLPIKTKQKQKQKTGRGEYQRSMRPSHSVKNEN